MDILPISINDNLNAWVIFYKKRFSHNFLVCQEGCKSCFGSEDIEPLCESCEEGYYLWKSDVNARNGHCLTSGCHDSC